MGKHNKQSPRRVSLLATMGGLFATVLLTAGLFGATGLIGSGAPHQHNSVQVPTIATTTQPVNKPIAPDINTGIQIDPTIVTPAPTPEQHSATPVQVPDTSVVGVDADAQVAVPLLGTATDTVVDTVTQIVKDITNPIINILGE